MAVMSSGCTCPLNRFPENATGPKRGNHGAHKEGISGAIIWLDDTDGKTLVFTRGEYRSRLLYNIDNLRQEARLFTHNMNTGEEIDDGKNIAYPES